MARQADSQLDAFGSALGATIRSRRKELGLSLVEVAERTGLSHAFISQLERGKTRASMRSLFAIARALGTTQEQLISWSTREAPDATVEMSGSRDSRARLLMHSGDQLDITELSGLPFEAGGFFQHERPEFLYVVSGSIEFEMRAAEDSPGTTLLLAAGQSTSCPGGMLHRYRSVGELPATVLMVHYLG